eukprot:TRINITY_DN3334_c0_g1_i10.p1 TRINITY_DN3334_c0_g1~~TRINITY_DN3334_c0_g1_i10.p1  ORF type:complete len:157 (-),score=31.09 TRINITY_DN3334_c0_g1_i10:71-541(-)
MAMAGEEFMEIVDILANSWFPAREIVEEMVRNRKNIPSLGSIAILPRFCPWVSHLLDIEKELGIEGEILYVLFQDPKGEWRIQSVPLNLTSFDNRASLPSAWRGLRDQNLSDVTGIEGCIFVHANGFIGGNKTKDGILMMAHVALNIAGRNIQTNK